MTELAGDGEIVNVSNESPVWQPKVTNHSGETGGVYIVAVYHNAVITLTPAGTITHQTHIKNTFCTESTPHTRDLSPRHAQRLRRGPRLRRSAVVMILAMRSRASPPSARPPFASSRLCTCARLVGWCADTPSTAHARLENLSKEDGTARAHTHRVSRARVQASGRKGGRKSGGLAWCLRSVMTTAGGEPLT